VDASASTWRTESAKMKPWRAFLEANKLSGITADAVRSYQEKRHAKDRHPPHNQSRSEASASCYSASAPHCAGGEVASRPSRPPPDTDASRGTIAPQHSSDQTRVTGRLSRRPTDGQWLTAAPRDSGHMLT
jgi:hypothetical protein